MKPKRDLRKTILGFAAGLNALALLFVAWVYTEIPTASYVLAGTLVVLLGLLAWLNQKDLKAAAKSRTLRYGTNALVTIGLVLSILVVVNYLNFNHHYRKDLTKNQLYSLSDQTVKIIKGLKQELKFTVFTKTAERDAAKGVLNNYLYHTDKITVEYVDPDRDPIRAKAANVKKYNTVIVTSGTRDTRIEEINEEKITNAMLKVLKDKAVTVCFLTGHGEHPLDAVSADSFSQLKSEFTSQNYQAKSVNLIQEGKIPEDCTVMMVMGPTKAFFDKELKIFKDWLVAGGRAMIALDPVIKGSSSHIKDLKELLEDWHIKIPNNLVLDPTSRLLKVTEAVPVVAIFSKEHPVTKDFQQMTLFPLTSTIELIPSPPTSLKTWWLAKSTPKAFAIDDLTPVATGKPISLDSSKNQPGPHVVMVAAEGGKTAQDKKDEESKSRVTRLVVMGTSQLAVNQWSRYGANSDLFMNAVSWLADDESLISIRPKEAGTQMPALEQTEARWIQLLTMFLIPGGVLLLGGVIWFRRRRL